MEIIDLQVSYVHASLETRVQHVFRLLKYIFQSFL